MGTSERQLLLALFAWLCMWLLLLVYGGGCFTVNFACLPTCFNILGEFIRIKCSFTNQMLAHVLDVFGKMHRARDEVVWIARCSA